MTNELRREDEYLKVIRELEAKLTSTHARALDDTNRADGYLKIIGELEGKLASTEARAIDETNRAVGYLKVIRDVEAQAARAENRLAALTPGGPPEFPPLDQSPDDMRLALAKYVAAVPDRIEMALSLYRLEAHSADKTDPAIATQVYLHFLLGDYDRAYRALRKLDLTTLAVIIPHPQRMCHAFLWLLCKFGHRDDATELLQRVAALGDKYFEALQLPGATVARQADAQQRRVPAILFNTTPKSGTVFLQSSLSQVLDAPILRISVPGFADERVVPELARRFAEGGAVGFHHIPATAKNLDILKRSGVTRIAVHCRDPRQCVTSLFSGTQHAWNVEHWSPASGLDFGELPPPDNFVRMSSTELRDWVIKTYAPIYCRWIEDWVEAAHNITGLDVKIVTYEDFVRDKSGYYTGIAEFFGLDGKRVVPKLLELEPKEGVMHFRSGRLDEWREVLTEAERELFSSLMKPEICERFGWQK